MNNSIKSLSLSGSHYEMGISYGSQMHGELQGALGVLKDFFINKHHVTYDAMVAKSNEFYNRYSNSYKYFLKGISDSTGLSMDDVNILNGMETINSLAGSEVFDTPVGACAFMFLPPEKSANGSSIIGRNYDFPAPYSTIAQNLTITTLTEPEHSTVTIIGLPGQIYCPSCVNDKGFFMELNNGMPSGGYYDDISRQSLLIDMLHINQGSSEFEQVGNQLRATQSDYSLIINTANATSAKSYEFSTTLGMKEFEPKKGEVFVSTNFFQNTTWGNEIPKPTDNTTWEGVTRRDNLLNLASKQEKFSVQDFQKLMEVGILDGGGCWPMTIYQIVFTGKDLYVRPTDLCKGDWKHFELNAVGEQEIDMDVDF
ncbi:MAG: hypothetical protein K0T99_01315 [Alphaproteobacteria bacterium]|nr:hypothetical protein [Alphaproteobacteria bacterium]